MKNFEVDDVVKGVVNKMYPDGHTVGKGLLVKVTHVIDGGIFRGYNYDATERDVLTGGKPPKTYAAADFKLVEKGQPSVDVVVHHSVSEPTRKFKPSEIKAMQERIKQAEEGGYKARIPLKSVKRMLEAGLIVGDDLIKHPRQKSQSRASRCADACNFLSNAENTLTQVAEDIEGFINDDESEDDDKFVMPTAEQLKDWQADIDGADSDLQSGAEEINALAEEMGSWRDNIEEKFSQTQKFEDVSTAADALENAQNELEGVTIPSTVNVANKADLESLAEDLHTAAQEIESGRNEAEGVDFPGKF